MAGRNGDNRVTSLQILYSVICFSSADQLHLKAAKKRKLNFSTLAQILIFTTFFIGLAANPVSSDGSTLCGDAWFYGYQSVGIQYTVGDTNAYSWAVVGGTVPGGCKTLSPSGSFFPNDKCAIIEIFTQKRAVTPAYSFLIGKFPLQTGIKLGVTGILAISMGKNSGSSTIFGVLQIGSGADYTSNPIQYTPDGTELAFIKIISSGDTYSTIYLTTYFKGYNCGVNKRTLDLYSFQSLIYLSFQQCDSPYDNYILSINVQNDNIKSLTKFPQTSVAQWYAMSGDRQGLENAFFTGIASNPTRLLWLVTQENNGANNVAVPQCMYSLYFDSNWATNVGSVNLVPAVAEQASRLYNTREGVVVLHSPTTSYNCFVVLLSQDHLCTSQIDAITYCSLTPTDEVKVIDMQLYSDTYWLGTAAQLLVQIQGDLYILQFLVNDKKTSTDQRGWRRQAKNLSVLKINTLASNSLNPLFDLNQMSNFVLGQSFMYKNDLTFKPVMLGQSSAFYTGVTDGFVLRDTNSASTCISYDTSVVTFSSLFSAKTGYCFFTPIGINLTSPYVQLCGAQSGVIAAEQIGQQLAIPSSYVSNPSTFLWAASDKASFTVKNPCMVSVKSSDLVDQIVLIGSSAALNTFSMTFDDNCPYQTYTTTTAPLDYQISNVVYPSTVLTSPTIIAHYDNPTVALEAYQQLAVTDLMYEGTYQFTFKTFVQGDSNSVCSAAMTQTIQIKIVGCTYTSSFPPTLPDKTYNIGTPTTFDLTTQFAVGDCFYSTSQDQSTFWTTVSSYTSEVLVPDSPRLYVVLSTSTSPSLQIQTSNQNYAGDHTYYFTYIDYKGISYQAPQKFTFVQTDCKEDLSGLSTLQSSYSQSVLSETQVTIDLSVISNYQCRYMVDLAQQTGPVTSNFMSLSQPTFVQSSTFVYTMSTSSGKIEILLTGKIADKKVYVGDYTFDLQIKEYYSPFQLIESTTITVSIVDCTTVWLVSQNLAQVNYILGEKTEVDIPSYVDAKLGNCNPVSLSYKSTTGVDLSDAIIISLTDTYQGTGVLNINTENNALRGSQSIQITCTDSTGLLLSHYLPINIKHLCESSIITTFSNFDQVISLTGQTQTIKVPAFTSSIAGCEQIQMEVSFSVVSGFNITSWFSFDLSSFTLTLSQLDKDLSVQSVIQVTLQGSILGQSWLPTAKASFKVTVQSTVVATTVESKKSQANSVGDKEQTVSNDSTITNPATEFDFHYLDSQNQTKQDPTPLYATITQISSTGLVTVKFNKPMQIPSMYANITQRRKETNFTETIQKYINLQIRSSFDESSGNRTQIVYFNLTDFQKGFLTLQVVFLNPTQLSLSYAHPDNLQIIIKEKSLFISQSGARFGDNTQLSKAIPTQVAADEAKAAQALAQSAQSSMNTIATVNVVVNLVLSFGLKYLWNFVNILQFLVFMPRWKISVPLNSLAILDQLKSIALMEFIPTNQITGTVSGWLGMDSTDESNIVNSFGAMLVIGLGIVLVVVAIGVASYFVQKSYSAYKTYREIKGNIFYNTFYRFIIQSVLKMGLASGTTLATVSWTNFTFSTGLSAAMAIITLLVFGLSPLIFWIVLKKNLDQLARPSTQKRMGTLYLAIKDQNLHALAYTPIFMLRRLTFIALTFSLTQQPSLQIHFFTFSNLFYISFLGLVVPHSLSAMTNQELINETLLVLVCYHFILFAGLVNDLDIKSKLGMSQIILVGLILLFNISVVMGANIIQLKRKFQLWKLQRASRKALKIRLQRTAMQLLHNKTAIQQQQDQLVVEDYVHPPGSNVGQNERLVTLNLQQQRHHVIHQNQGINNKIEAMKRYNDQMAEIQRKISQKVSENQLVFRDPEPRTHVDYLQSIQQNSGSKLITQKKQVQSASVALKERQVNLVMQNEKQQIETVSDYIPIQSVQQPLTSYQLHQQQATQTTQLATRRQSMSAEQTQAAYEKLMASQKKLIQQYL